MSGSSGFAEKMKRHGYSDGARTLYRAIYQHIPPRDQVLVNEWLTSVERWEKNAPIENHVPPIAPLNDVSKTSGA